MKPRPGRCVAWSTRNERPQGRALPRVTGETDMQDTARPISTIRDYHAHVYYEPATTRAAAEALRAKIDCGFVVRLGRWHDALVGPHTGSMYQVAFATD